MVFEALSFHDVAPVAGGVAYGEEDGFVELFGEVKSFRGPWMPINGVVGVLEEVGALFGE